MASYNPAKLLGIHDRTAAESVRFVMIDVLIIFLTAMTTALSRSLGWMKLSILYAVIMAVLMLIVGLVLKGIGRGPIMSGMFAMTADVVDYGEWKTGLRYEGLINSCTSFGMKVGIGLGSAVTGWILAPVLVRPAGAYSNGSWVGFLRLCQCVRRGRSIFP